MKTLILFFVSVIFLCSCGDDNSEQPDDKIQTGEVEGLTKQVEQNPDSIGLRMKLINSLDSLKLYDKAIANTDSLIKRDSLNSGLWLTKAQLQENNKDTSNAITSYKRALRIYPSVDAQLYLANLFAETKNPDALKLCANVKKMRLGRENDANSNFIAGIYFSRTGNEKQALELFDQAINDNYTLMEAYMEKGFIYYDNKKFSDAQKIYDKAITVNNTYADAYYWKAKCLEAMGNRADALTNYERALGLDRQMQAAREAIDRMK